MIDDKNEATFIAVEEMEKITNLSQQGKTFRKMKAVYLDKDSCYSLTTFLIMIINRQFITQFTVKEYSKKLEAINQRQVLKSKLQLKWALKIHILLNPLYPQNPLLKTSSRKVMACNKINEKKLVIC